MLMTHYGGFEGVHHLHFRESDDVDTTSLCGADVWPAHGECKTPGGWVCLGCVSVAAREVSQLFQALASGPEDGEFVRETIDAWRSGRYAQARAGSAPVSENGA